MRGISEQKELRQTVGEIEGEGDPTCLLQQVRIALVCQTELNAQSNFGVESWLSTLLIARRRNVQVRGTPFQGNHHMTVTGQPIEIKFTIFGECLSHDRRLPLIKGIVKTYHGLQGQSLKHGLVV